jgi:hypothetical protein
MALFKKLATAIRCQESKGSTDAANVMRASRTVLFAVMKSCGTSIPGNTPTATGGVARSVARLLGPRVHMLGLHMVQGTRSELSLIERALEFQKTIANQNGAAVRLPMG